MSETSEMIRIKFGETDTKRDAGLKTPEDVVRWDNLAYGNDPVWQILDVYRPREAGISPLPVIVSVHGGGWVYGDKERYQFYCMNLAQHGFAVVNFTYRLAPEHKFPAPLEDTCMVFRWVLEHADKYGFDTEHTFAVGDSAGAHTLGLFSAMCSNLEYASCFSFAPPKGFIPTAIALNCGVNTVNVSDDPRDRFSTSLMADYLEGKGTEEELSLVNVRGWMTESFPPTFLMSAEDDFLKYDMPPIIHRLIEKNVPFVVQFHRDSSVKLGHVFHLDIRLDASRRCNDAECDYFKGFLR